MNVINLRFAIDEYNNGKDNALDNQHASHC